MPRGHSSLSLKILKDLDTKQPKMLHGTDSSHVYKESSKTVYDTLYRLKQQGLVEDTKQGYILTEEGYDFIHRTLPEKDGIWKIVIFDIPEKQRPVRNFLRQKLVALGFKKWQASIWISPYKLEEGIERELEQLAKHYFIRLIKTRDINVTKDLEKMFS